MKLFLSGAVLFSLLAFGSASGAQEPERDVVLRPGDAVQITVWRRPELTGEFAITEDGSIAHPLYRQVRISDVPLAAVESRMREYLAQLEANPQFIVQPLLRVSVGGEVRQPNLYRLPPVTSIAEAVAMAGGATERGRLDQVRLFRDGTEQTIDLTSPEAGLGQQPIRSGDQIFVRRRVALFREYLAPGASITAALVGVLNLLIRAL